MPLIHLSIAALGDPGSVSYSLSRILQLAESFGAFVLIDEADILLKKRNIDNLQHNNIVTSVLKELESFNGLLFLTSNLAFEHVDDAIRSRLKRRICFEYPTKDVLLKVWKLNLDNIGLQLNLEELEKIAKISFELKLDLRKVVNICSLLHDLLSYDPKMEINVLSYVWEA
jgi:AAA+ superfamily predicted ATPase